MSQISEWVREYLAGGISYEQMLDRLAGFPLADPWARHLTSTSTVAQRNAVVDSSTPDIDGTLLELREATVHLGLPWDVYRRLRSDLAAATRDDTGRSEG